MSLSGRDKKILLGVLPLLLIVGYWFLLLGPKRDDAAKAGTALAKQEQRRDKAQAAARSAEATKANFASDYATLVKLGKAVPTQLDLPTVMVQLEDAARGTGIGFTRIATGERAPTAPAATQPPAAPGSGDGSQPAAAGGAPAQSTPGGAAESAGNSVNNANATSANTEQSGVSPGDTQTSSSARQGGLPVGGGATGATAGGAAGPSSAAGLESVPLELGFQGNFFRLADFFHAMKRFVHVANRRMSVGGRLLTVESLKFASDPEIFPKLDAELTATVYLAPQGEGATAGATPTGPAPTTPAANATASGGGPAPSTPTATATP